MYYKLTRGLRKFFFKFPDFNKLRTVIIKVSFPPIG